MSQTCPYGVKLKWFDVQGTPARQLRPYVSPEIFRDGQWTPFGDTPRFWATANPISEQAFNHLVAAHNDGNGYPPHPDDVKDAALLAMLTALGRNPGPDGMPSVEGQAGAQRVASWLQNAPDGSLAARPATAYARQQEAECYAWVKGDAVGNKFKWRDSDTGKTRVQIIEPGTRGKGAAPAGQQQAGAQPQPVQPVAQPKQKPVAQPKPVKAPKPTVEKEGRQLLKDFSGTNGDPAALVAQLSKFTVVQLKELTKEVQAKIASKADKGERINQLAAKILAGAGVQAPPMPAKEPAPWEPDAEAPKPGHVYNAPLDALHVDPTRFQFKVEGVGKDGVTAKLKQVKTWNDKFAGVVSVWKDPKDGKTYVINGHHRADLAKRLGVKNLAVRYLDPHEAQNAVEARAQGALINMAEGRGTPLDAAKFMRDMGVGPDDLEKHGVSMQEDLAKDATILTKLSPRSFDNLTSGRLDQPTALAVAKHLDDHDKQDTLFRMLDKQAGAGKKPTPKVVEEMARSMAMAPMATGDENGEQGPMLPGMGVVAEPLFIHRAEMTAHLRGKLTSEVNDFLMAASKRRAAKLGESGNVLNVEENRKIAEQAEQVRGAFDTLVNRKGPIADAVNTATEAYYKAKNNKERERARKQAFDAVQQAAYAEAGLSGDSKPPVSGSVGASVPGSEAAGAAQPGTDADGRAANIGRGDVATTGLAEPATAPVAPKPTAKQKPSAKPLAAVGVTADPVAAAHEVSPQEHIGANGPGSGADHFEQVKQKVEAGEPVAPAAIESYPALKAKQAAKQAAKQSPKQSPAVAPTQSPATKRLTTPDQHDQAIMDEINRLSKERPGDYLHPLHEIRAKLKAEHPEISHEDFDRAVKRLRYHDHLDTAVISDLSTATPEQLHNSVQGDNETHFSVLNRNYQDPELARRAAQAALQASEQHATPPASEQHATKPEPKVGETMSFPATANGRNAFALKVDKVDDQFAYLSHPGTDYVAVKIPRDSLAQYRNDLMGKVEAPLTGDNPHVDAVISGKAKLLGHGDDGMAFDTGDGKIVKVSSVVPFHPTNPGTLTPEQAIDQARDQFATAKAMFKAGIPGMMKQIIRQEGDKVFTVRDKLDIPDKFTPDQVEQVRQSMNAMHKAGYSLNDDAQVGVGADGKVYHYDIGKAAKSTHKDDFEDDSSRFQRWAEKYGEKGSGIFDRNGNHLPLAKESEKKFNDAMEKMNTIANKPEDSNARKLLTSPLHWNHLERMRQGIIANDPSRADEVNKQYNALRAKAGLPPREDATPLPPETDKDELEREHAEWDALAADGPQPGSPAWNKRELERAEADQSKTPEQQEASKRQFALDAISSKAQELQADAAKRGKPLSPEFLGRVTAQQERLKKMAQVADTGMENGKEISPARRKNIEAILHEEAADFLAKMSPNADEQLTGEQAKKAKKAAAMRAQTKAKKAAAMRAQTRATKVTKPKVAVPTPDAEPEDTLDKPREQQATKQFYKDAKYTGTDALGNEWKNGQRIEASAGKNATDAQGFAAISNGQEGYVNGHRLIREGPDRFQMQTDAGIVRGTAAEIQARIDRASKDQGADKRRIDAAMQRHEAAGTPALFTPQHAAEAEGFGKLAHGEQVAITQGNYKGRTGKIDTSEGAPKVKLAGTPGLVPVSPEAVEPLDPSKSWRGPPAPKQGGMFGADATSGKAPARPDPFTDLTRVANNERGRWTMPSKGSDSFELHSADGQWKIKHNKFGDDFTLISATGHKRQFPSAQAAADAVAQAMPQVPRPDSVSPEIDKLPREVRQRIEHAVGKLKDLAATLEQGRLADKQFSGGGRYESETHENHQQANKHHLDKARATLAEFHKLAQQNGIDAAKVMAEVGLPPESKLKPSKAAEDWWSKSAREANK